MTITEQLKKDLWGHNLADVARVTGLSYPTVYAVAKGSTNATMATVEKINAYLKDFKENDTN